MKERPILFTGEMVKAILDGRKTQTRRVVRGDVAELAGHALYYGPVVQGPLGYWGQWRLGQFVVINVPGCPYGLPGDELWVRETWRYYGGGWHSDTPRQEDVYIEYAADNKHSIITRTKGDFPGLPRMRPQGEDEGEEERHRYCCRFWAKKRPSIHMPRWASRIQLVVKDVRVERVQEIHGGDAITEGWPGNACDCVLAGERVHALMWFRKLWDSVNGKKPGCSWADSPWAWVVTFEVKEAK